MDYALIGILSVLGLACISVIVYTIVRILDINNDYDKEIKNK